MRMAIDCALCFSKKDDEESYKGNVINLSSKGILFTSNTQMDVGTTLDIILTPSNTLTPPMYATATVSRVSEVDSVYEMACGILEIK